LPFTRAYFRLLRQAQTAVAARPAMANASADGSGTAARPPVADDPAIWP
jgi:hypothetical protein